MLFRFPGNWGKQAQITHWPKDDISADSVLVLTARGIGEEDAWAGVGGGGGGAAGMVRER